MWIVPRSRQGPRGARQHDTSSTGIPQETAGPRKRVDMGPSERATLAGSGADAEVSKAKAAVEAAIA